MDKLDLACVATVYSWCGRKTTRQEKTCPSISRYSPDLNQLCVFRQVTSYFFFPTSHSSKECDLERVMCDPSHSPDILSCLVHQWPTRQSSGISVDTNSSITLNFCYNVHPFLSSSEGNGIPL